MATLVGGWYRDLDRRRMWYAKSIKCRGSGGGSAREILVILLQGAVSFSNRLAS